LYQSSSFSGSVLRASLRRKTRGFANELADAFVVEHDGAPIGADVDPDSAAADQSLGTIDFDPVAAHKLNREWPERRSPHQRAQRSFKGFRDRVSTLPISKPRK
jgi:hypothetical protein